MSNSCKWLNMSTLGKWFKARTISSLFCVIVRVRVVFRKIVVGDWAVVIFRVKGSKESWLGSWLPLTNNSLPEDYPHPDDHTRQTNERLFWCKKKNGNILSQLLEVFKRIVSDLMSTYCTYFPPATSCSFCCWWSSAKAGATSAGTVQSPTTQLTQGEE